MSTETPIINKADNTYTYQGKKFGLNSKGTAYEEIKPPAPLPQIHTSVSPVIADMMADPSKQKMFQDTTKDTGNVDIYNKLMAVNEPTARDELAKYYADQQGQDVKSAKSNADVSAVDYQNTIDSLNKGLQEDAATLADKEGQQGTWGSSARADRMSSLAGKYNTKYSEAFNNARAAADKNNIANEGVYGADATITPDITGYGATSIGTPITTSTYKYNPFGGVGTFGATKSTAAKSLAKQKTLSMLSDKIPNY